MKHLDDIREEYYKPDLPEDVMEDLAEDIMADKKSKKCLAELHIGDDYGDNCCTMHCQLPIGHEDRHKEEYEQGDELVTVQWEKAEDE